MAARSIMKASPWKSMRMATQDSILGFNEVFKADKASPWRKVEMGPPDPILGINEAFKADKSTTKLNLGVGAYRDDQGKPYLLPSVIAAEKRILEKRYEKEYLPITGLPRFNKLATSLIYGADSPPILENRLAVAQSCSGTGALRYGGMFLSRFYENKEIYLPTPTWGNHKNIFKDSGLNVKSYRYYDPEHIKLDLGGMLEDIEKAKNGSIILLHACAHNPTGVDPSEEQWKQISDAIQKKEHLVFFDSAYQGFASGDCDKDAFAVRHFVKQGHPIFLSQSFAKNMGLYGERIGTFSMVTASEEERARVDSQLKILIRPMISNPPIHGALIVSEILDDKTLKEQWLSEVKGMADRIILMRESLRENLEKKNKSKLDWSHITSQIGMFCYTGLKQGQVDKLRREYHIYMTSDGRISMAGVNQSNVDYLAQAIHKVSE